jgi:uncharacterized protein (TIGR02145 family)
MAKLNFLVIFLIGFCGIMAAQTLTIGSQVWMTKNLDVSNFSNGDIIFQAKTDEEWIKAGEEKKPAWCYYNNDPANETKYGKLYNWYAVNDPRGLAPKGWHIPSEEELVNLSQNLGGNLVSGGKLKSKSGWKNNGNGSDQFGFTGSPGGYRYIVNGSFNDIGIRAIYWTSTEMEIGSPHAHFGLLNYKNNEFDMNDFTNPAVVFFKGNGLSVRCLKD